MLATLLAIIFAVILFFLPPVSIAAESLIGIAMAVSTGVIFLLAGGAHVMIWNPIQKSAQNLSAKLMEMFRIDPHIRYPSIWLMLAFPVVGFALSIDAMALHIIRPFPLIAAWTILFGFSIDLLYHLLKRVSSYLDPFAIVGHFTEQAEEMVREDQDAELCQWIEAISETGIKGIEKTLPSLCNLATSNLEKISNTYFSSEKSIAHHPEEHEGKTDKISYTLIFILQRLELIYKKALDQKMETVCQKIVTSTGKIVLDSAKYDLSLAAFPLRSIDLFAKSALEHKMLRLAELITCTLLEVSREISERDIQYFDLKDPFFTIIATLEVIAEKSFRQDKKASIPLLVQPFKDLADLFDKEKLKKHQDAAAIRTDIARVLDQFAQLELVMRSVPPVNLEEQK